METTILQQVRVYTSINHIFLGIMRKKEKSKERKKSEKSFGCLLHSIHFDPPQCCGSCPRKRMRAESMDDG
jgi:hypothetical protein